MTYLDKTDINIYILCIPQFYFLFLSSLCLSSGLDCSVFLSFPLSQSFSLFFSHSFMYLLSLPYSLFLPFMHMLLCICCCATWISLLLALRCHLTLLSVMNNQRPCAVRVKTSVAAVKIMFKLWNKLDFTLNWHFNSLLGLPLFISYFEGLKRCHVAVLRLSTTQGQLVVIKKC